MGTRAIEQRNILRLRDRNADQGRDCLFYVPTDLQDIALHQYDGKTASGGRAATESAACHQPILVHAIETTSPRPLSLGNHLASSPGSQLETSGDDVERKVVVAHQRRASITKPYRLATTAEFCWRPIMAQNLLRALIIANKGAYPIVVGYEFGHVA